MKRLIALGLALIAPMAALAAESTWTFDPTHSHASFSIRHLVISNVRGEFRKLSGAVRLDEQDVTKSSVEATIPTASVDTRVDARDKDLRSANFFDVAKYPNITFKSTKVEKAGEGKLKVTGDLTIKNVTKPVVLDVTGPTAELHDPWGGTRRGISATTKINRREFGLSYSAMIEAGPVVGDEATIEIEAELLKQAPKQATN
jgi:polyisoprenoid-binding protein YceI